MKNHEHTYVIKQLFKLLFLLFKVSSFTLNKPFISTAPTNVSVACIPTMTLGLVADPMNFSLRLFSSIDHCIDVLVVSIARGYNFSIGRKLLQANKYLNRLQIIEKPYRIFSVQKGGIQGLECMQFLRNGS